MGSRSILRPTHELTHGSRRDMHHPLLSAPYNALMYLFSAVKAAAMFTLLPPSSRLGAFGQKYYWRDGEAVMFDETYIHQAENRTGVTRVILFCDIERPLSNPVLRWINRTIGRRMIRAAATQNVPGEHVGALNHIFSFVYQIRALGERIKAWSRPVYYALKWSLLATLCYELVVGI